MALRISRKLWRRGRPLFSGVGSSPSMHSHSALVRSVRYVLLMHARVAASIPDYPFSDSFMAKFAESLCAGRDIREALLRLPADHGPPQGYLSFVSSNRTSAAQLPTTALKPSSDRFVLSDLYRITVPCLLSTLHTHSGPHRLWSAIPPH
jgi:hypothetical protein